MTTASPTGGTQSAGGSAGGSYLDASMIYSKRAAEKRDMQNLNQRLQYYVGINQQQHKDYLRMQDSYAAANEAFNQRCGAKDQEIGSTNARFQEERNQLSGALANAQGVAAGALGEANKLSAGYAQLTDQYVGLDGAVQADEAKLGTVATNLKAYQSNLDKGKRDLMSRYTQSASLKVKLSEVDRDCQGLDQVTNALNQQLSSTRDRFASMKQQREQEIQGLGDKITERKAAQKRLEEELRKEFQDKLNQFVGLKASQYEEEKTEWMKIFKDEYNKKIQAYKSKNRTLGTMIRDAHGEKKNFHDTILQKKSQIAELTQTRRGIEADIDNQRAQYDATTKTIRDLKAALARKAQEFDELLAARISLENEVVRYAELVGAEERRCNLATKD